MNQKYFLYAFAVDGDLTEIPNPTQSSGLVSYQDGYSSLYSEDPLTVGTALEVDRAMFNAVMYDVTSVLQNWQQWGSPEWITSANNNGTPYSYGLGAIVRYSTTGTAPFTTYLSRVSNNTTTPSEGANWSQLATYSLVAAETSRAEAEEAVLATSIAAETTRAQAAEALLAPKANPTFIYNVTISGGVISQSGPGTNNFAASINSSGNINAGGAISAGSYLYAPLLETSPTGYLSVGTGASNIGGSLNVAGALSSNNEISNPWFYSNGSYLYTAVNFIVSGTTILSGGVICSSGLTVNGGGLIATDNAEVFGSLTITNGSVSGGWQCYPYGAGNPALVASVGLVAGTYGFTATAGWFYGPSGAASAPSGITGQFGFSSGAGYVQGLGFAATSDIRLKRNIKPITTDDAFRFIQNVEPVEFDWTTDGTHAQGYIAQQTIAAGFSHLIGALPNIELEDAEHEYEGGIVKSVKGIQLHMKYNDAQPYYHAAIAGLMNKLDAALARIAELEARLKK